MPASEPILFEAICTPPRQLSRYGLWLLTVLLVLSGVVMSVVFLLLGAWPVLGFVGGEIGLVVGLLFLYRRWADRTREVVRLTESQLLVRRPDRRGRMEEVRLTPYWTRLRLEERPGRVPGLCLWQRHRRVEIGQHLSEAEKRDLADALGEALRRYREPVFDNPQLLEC